MWLQVFDDHDLQKKKKKKKNTWGGGRTFFVASIVCVYFVHRPVFQISTRCRRQEYRPTLDKVALVRSDGQPRTVYLKRPQQEHSDFVRIMALNPMIAFIVLQRQQPYQPLMSRFTWREEVRRTAVCGYSYQSPPCFIQFCVQMGVLSGNGDKRFHYASWLELLTAGCGCGCEPGVVLPMAPSDTNDETIVRPAEGFRVHGEGNNISAQPWIFRTAMISMTFQITAGDTVSFFMGNVSLRKNDGVSYSNDWSRLWPCSVMCQWIRYVLWAVLPQAILRCIYRENVSGGLLLFQKRCCCLIGDYLRKKKNGVG